MQPDYCKHLTFEVVVHRFVVLYKQEVRKGSKPFVQWNLASTSIDANWCTSANGEDFFFQPQGHGR